MIYPMASEHFQENIHSRYTWTPSQSYTHHVGYQWRSVIRLIKQELARMEKFAIIAKLTEPTDWVNSTVVVHKRNGDQPVCLDPRDLNAAIKRPYYPVPTLEDVTSKLAGARHFSVLDARSGYWQIKLAVSTSRLTTFNTPFGRYCYFRIRFPNAASTKCTNTCHGLPA